MSCREEKFTLRKSHKGIDLVVIHNLGGQNRFLAIINLFSVDRDNICQNHSKNIEQKNQVKEKYIQPESIMLSKSK